MTRISLISATNPITVDDIGKWGMTRSGHTVLVACLRNATPIRVIGTLFDDGDNGSCQEWFASGRRHLGEIHPDDIASIETPCDDVAVKHVGDLVAAAETLVASLRTYLFKRTTGHDEAGSEADRQVLLSDWKAVKNALAAYEAALAKDGK